MAVRVSALFDSLDSADAAVRGMDKIPIYKRRISRIGDGTLGEPTVLSGGSDVFVIGGIGQGFSQGISLPMLMSVSNDKSGSFDIGNEVQLEVWVDDSCAREAVNRLINAHGLHARRD